MRATPTARSGTPGGRVEEMAVPAGGEAARIVLRSAAAALREAGWPATGRADVALALDEAVQNAVEHGSLARAPVEVRIEAAPERVRVVVADRGRPGAATPVGSPRPPGVHDVRGRGRLIMRALADEARWHPRPGGGTRVELIFRRTRAPGPLTTTA